MSLSAVLLAKVLRDLPGPYRRTVLALAPLAAAGFLTTRPAYQRVPLVGVVALVLGSFCAVAAASAIVAGYRERQRPS